MRRHLAWFCSTMVMLAVSAPLRALSYEVGGCKTGPGYVNFTTISAAVIGVPAGAKILVCPGTYPEQVTITQPLTLQGIASGNANRAVIAINRNASFAPNVTSATFAGHAFYAQVLVQNVNPAGPVNIVGITVDGTGANSNFFNCSSTNLAGIFYASSTSGTVNEVTARNQAYGVCAFGIWVENGSGTNQTITIENSSVHNVGYGGGIWASYADGQPTLTASIIGNFVTAAGGNEILTSANGSISGNVVTCNNDISCNNGAYVLYSGGSSNTVSGNTVADAPYGIGTSSSVLSNKVSNVAYPLDLQNASLTVKSNTIMNATCGNVFDEGGNTIKGNVFNDWQYAPGTAPTTGNSLFNIDALQSTNCP